MPIVAGADPAVPPMTQANKDALIAHLTKAASAGATILSNASLAKKLALTIPTDGVTP